MTSEQCGDHANTGNPHRMTASLLAEVTSLDDRAQPEKKATVFRVKA